MGGTPTREGPGHASEKHTCYFDIFDNIEILIGTNSNNIQFFSDMPGFTTTWGILPVNIIVLKLRLDIVIVNTKKKSIHLVELTVPFEHNISKAHEPKPHKYADPVLDIFQNGYNCNLTCIEVGSRSLVTPDTNKIISEIFASIKAKPPKSLKKDFSKITILSSYTIWNACYQRGGGGGGTDQPHLKL